MLQEHIIPRSGQEGQRMKEKDPFRTTHHNHRHAMAFIVVGGSLMTFTQQDGFAVIRNNRRPKSNLCKSHTLTT